MQYRVAAWAGFSTQVFWGFIKVMAFAAFYASASGAAPMSFQQVVTYVWLGQGFLALLPWNVDPEIAQDVRSGRVAYELARPLDLYSYWFVRTLAFRLIPTALRVVPMLVFAGFVLPFIGLGHWSLSPPASGASAAGFAVAIAMTLLLSTAITMLMHIALMWTLAGEGLNRLMPGVVLVLSGMVAPLPFFPEIAQPFLEHQPFRGLADLPFRIYTGDIPVSSVPLQLLEQLVWVGVLIASGLGLMSRARAKLVVQGG